MGEYLATVAVLGFIMALSIGVQRLARRARGHGRTGRTHDGCGCGDGGVE